MAAGPWVVYNDFKLNMAKGLVNLATDTFKIALFTSTSIAISATVTPATYTSFAAGGNEVANANGYVTGGVVAGAPTLTGGGAVGTITLALPNLSFAAATGAGYTSRVAVLYDSTSASKVAVAYMLLDATPADLTVVAPQILTIQVGSVFTETGN